MKILGKSAHDAQDPTKLVPHGDRLLVEEVEVEDVVLIATPNGLKRIQIARASRRSARDPRPEETSDELTEIARGWKLARVVAVGDGHRLEIDVKVPMPFKPGDYVYIERLCGRPLDFQGVKHLVINQVDVLLHAPEIKSLIALQKLDQEAVPT